jgi:DNA-binding transcriptional LysR family regulator
MLPERVFPVCSPRLLHDHGGDPSAVLRTAARLHLKPAPGQHWFDWQAVGTAWDPDGVVAPAARPFDNYPLVLGAAMAGQGVAIGWQSLVDPLIAQGLLSRLGDAVLASRLGYHLVLPQRKRRPAASRDFAAWLLSELPPADRPPLDSVHG